MAQCSTTHLQLQRGSPDSSTGLISPLISDASVRTISDFCSWKSKVLKLTSVAGDRVASGSGIRSHFWTRGDLPLKIVSSEIGLMRLLNADSVVIFVGVVVLGSSEWSCMVDSPIQRGAMCRKNSRRAGRQVQTTARLVSTENQIAGVLTVHVMSESWSNGGSNSNRTQDVINVLQQLSVCTVVETHAVLTVLQRQTCLITPLFVRPETGASERSESVATTESGLLQRL